MASGLVELISPLSPTFYYFSFRERKKERIISRLYAVPLVFNSFEVIEPARASAPGDLSQVINTMSINRHEPPSSSSKEACSSSSKDGTYYGRVSSFYHTIEPAIVPQLEQAIVYGEVRAFREASELFEKLPSESHHHPVIAIEHAQVLWRQWALFDCRNALQTAVDWGHENATDFNERGIYTLLRIFLGKLMVFTKGDFTQARDSMKEVRAWLTRVPISEYSDIEVGCRRATYLSFADLVLGAMPRTLLLSDAVRR